MTQEQRGSGRGVASVLLGGLAAVVVLGAGGLVGAAGGKLAREHQVPLPPLAVPTGRATPAGVAAATSSPSALPSGAGGAAPTAAAVQAALAGPLADPRLGGRVSGQVVDLGTGTTLFSAAPTLAVAPASTIKIVTAAAALRTLDPESTVTTKVVAGSEPGTVVLVGGGDPTLSAATAGVATTYPGATRISALASQVRTALGTAPVTGVVVDSTLFAGSGTAPGWAPEDAPSEYAAPITATMVDGGRDAPTAEIRSAAPDLAAGSALAAALGAPDAAVSRTTTPTPSTARELGSVQSAPIAQIVEDMLKESDNVLAETLGRLVALATGKPATFAGAAAAVEATVPAAKADLEDTSGLSTLDRVSAGGLVATLREVAADDDLHALVADLPVAGWDGTLRDRYLTGSATGGAGRVRAKTGTLTGVSCLAGVVVTGDGRVLGFAMLADQVTPTYGGTLDAEAALDDVATALAGLP